MPFPFDAGAFQQIDALQDGVNQLWQFFQLHPDLPHPWSLSALGPSAYFNSAAADQLRKEFGREGWTQERCHIWREVLGVRIEMSMPQPQQQPFIL
jgi:hypothetical protein